MINIFLQKERQQIKYYYSTLKKVSSKYGLFTVLATYDTKMTT